MLIAAVVLAVLAGLLHVWIFVMESVLFDRPSIHARFAVRTQDVPVVRPWAYNQGFYNLFLGIGALVASERTMARAAATQGTLPLLAVLAVVATLLA
jgi:putative membrane protein